MRKQAIALLLFALPLGGCVVTDRGVESVVSVREWSQAPTEYAAASVPLMAVSGLVVATRHAARARRTRRAPVTTDYRDPGAPTDAELEENWRNVKGRRR